jgi:hypothetical protein
MPRYIGPFYTAENGLVVPLVSGFAHPTNQPLRSQLKRLARQQPDSYALPPLPQGSEAPYISYWKQPVNQFLRKRTPKRQQPQYPMQLFELEETKELITGWVHPTNEPVRAQLRRLGRQMPRYDKGGWLFADIQPYLPVPLMSWKHANNNPLRYVKQRRKQPQYPMQLFELEDTEILVTQWKQPVNQPLRYKKHARKQPSYIDRGGYFPQQLLPKMVLIALQRVVNPVITVTAIRNPLISVVAQKNPTINLKAVKNPVIKVIKTQLV